MSVKITDDDHDWAKIKHELDVLNRYQVVIGFWGNKKLLEIVTVLEYGTTIRAKNYDWLFIPSKNDDLGDDGLPMSTAEWREKHPDKPLFKAGHVLAINDKESPNGLKIIFYLVKQVKIPARPFLRKTSIENERKYARLVKVGVERIIDGQATGKGLLDLLGHTAVSDIRRTMRLFSKPGNAPLTIDNKGLNDPLIGRHAGGQGGALINKVTYKIIPKES